MKTFIKRILLNVFSFWAISSLFPQVHFANTFALVLAAFVLTFLMTFIKPILKILFLPVNLVTFGLFAWLVNSIVLAITIFLVPGMRVEQIIIPAFNAGPLVFASYELSKFWSVVFVSFLLSLGNGFFGWLL